MQKKKSYWKSKIVSMHRNIDPWINGLEVLDKTSITNQLCNKTNNLVFSVLATLCCWMRTNSPHSLVEINSTAGEISCVCKCTPIGKAHSCMHSSKTQGQNMKAGLFEPEPLAEIFMVERQREMELQTPTGACGMRLLTCSSRSPNRL